MSIPNYNAFRSPALCGRKVNELQKDIEARKQVVKKYNGYFNKDDTVATTDSNINKSQLTQRQETDPRREIAPLKVDRIYIVEDTTKKKAKKKMEHIEHTAKPRKKFGFGEKVYNKFLGYSMLYVGPAENDSHVLCDNNGKCMYVVKDDYVEMYRPI